MLLLPETLVYKKKKKHGFVWQHIYTTSWFQKKKKEKGREFVVMDTTYNPPRILILLIQM